MELNNPIVISVLAVLTFAALAAWLIWDERREERRMDAAERAADQAARDYDRRWKSYVPVRLEIELRDWGDELLENRWRWCVWDADADMAGGQVEGCLVPYGLGNAPTREQAEADARKAIAESHFPDCSVRVKETQESGT